jgi:hypothetical protein
VLRMHRCRLLLSCRREDCVYAALSHLPSKGSFAGKSGSATSLIPLTTTLADESV